MKSSFGLDGGSDVDGPCSGVSKSRFSYGGSKLLVPIWIHLKLRVTGSSVSTLLSGLSSVMNSTRQEMSQILIITHSYLWLYWFFLPRPITMQQIDRSSPKILGTLQPCHSAFCTNIRSRSLFWYNSTTCQVGSSPVFFCEWKKEFKICHSYSSLSRSVTSVEI